MSLAPSRVDTRYGREILGIVKLCTSWQPMHISQVHIKYFRIFEDLELAFSPGLNLIVGENNSGKTALIDAIRYALDTNSSEWVRVQESDFRRGQSRFSIQLKFEAITARQARVFVEHLTHESTDGKPGRFSVLY